MWLKHMLGEALRNCFVLPSRSTCGSSPFVARPWLPEQLPLCKGRKDIGRPMGGLPRKKVPRRYLRIEWYNIAERKRKQNQEMRGRSASSVDKYKKPPTEWAKPLFLQTSAWQLNLCEFGDVGWRQGMGSVLCRLFPGGSGKRVSFPSCIT